MNRSYVLLMTAVILLGSLLLFKSPEAAHADQPQQAVDFNGYWYQGKAELSRYALQQERYGEIREGDAVLIFVTEDFLADKQVKYEMGPRTDAVVSTLKMNMTRKFWTGIYPYSIMTSVFTPVDFQNYQTLKVSGTTQEWCGHTFTQMNHESPDQYRFSQYSYFQAEGDREFDISGAIPEDGLWTQLRLDPQALPTGDISLIPAAHFLRLRHKTAKAEKASAEISRINDSQYGDGDLIRYDVKYRDLPRRLSIVADAAFPHVIRYWEEASGNKGLVTKAKLTHQVLNNYWSLNGEEDSVQRQKLGLD